MTKAEYDARYKAILADRSLSISQAYAAQEALIAEAGLDRRGSDESPLPEGLPCVAGPALTTEEQAIVDAARARTEAEQARLDEAL